MGKMNDAFCDLVSGVQTIEIEQVRQSKVMIGIVQNLQELTVAVTALAAGQLDATKLVDRLIEMSLVVKGDSREAVLHRAQQKKDDTFAEMYPETPADEWPPPGCDAMDVRG